MDERKSGDSEVTTCDTKRRKYDRLGEIRHLYLPRQRFVSIVYQMLLHVMPEPHCLTSDGGSNGAGVLLHDTDP
jgi:hypothetical protein